MSSSNTKKYQVLTKKLFNETMEKKKQDALNEGIVFTEFDIKFDANEVYALASAEEIDNYCHSLYNGKLWAWHQKLQGDNKALLDESRTDGLYDCYKITKKACKVILYGLEYDIKVLNHILDVWKQFLRFRIKGTIRFSQNEIKKYEEQLRIIDNKKRAFEIISHSAK